LSKIFKDKLGIRHLKKASHGLEAYNIAIASNFDLIVMDLNMPVMNGFEATSKIKEYFDQSNIFLFDDPLYDQE